MSTSYDERETLVIQEAAFDIAEREWEEEKVKLLNKNKTYAKFISEKGLKDEYLRWLDAQLKN